MYNYVYCVSFVFACWPQRKNHKFHFQWIMVARGNGQIGCAAHKSEQRKRTQATTNEVKKMQQRNNWRELIGWDEVCMRASTSFNWLKSVGWNVREPRRKWARACAHKIHFKLPHIYYDFLVAGMNWLYFMWHYLIYQWFYCGFSRLNTTSESHSSRRLSR